MPSRLSQILILLIAATLLRLLFYEAYLPWWVGDSVGYSVPATDLYHGWLFLYNGGRTPGYPLFLFGCECLAGDGVENKISPRAGQIVVFAQTILGLLSVLLVDLTLERLPVRPRIRLPLALLYALLAPLAQFEMIILSETLSLFCLLLSVYLMAITIDRLRKDLPAGGPALWAGLASGAAVLTRPNLIFIWSLFFIALPLLGGVLFVRRLGPPPWRAWWNAAARCAMGGALLIASWLIFNDANTGYLGLTPMTELSRSLAVYNLFDQVHPRDRVVGAIMDKYYHRTNSHGESKRDYIWQAMPEIRVHYHEMPVRQDHPERRDIYFATYLGSVSSYLMREHPGAWLRNACEQIPLLFDFNMDQVIPGNGDPVSLTGDSVVKNAGAWHACMRLGRVDAPVILVACLLSFGALILSAVRIWRARDFPAALLSLVPFVLALGILLSMAAFCLLAGYDKRYSVPFFPEFVLCSGYVLEAIARALPANPAAACARASIL